MKNRRTKENARLRIYFDAIEQAKTTTNDAWLDAWIPTGQPWMSREDFIKVLEAWALEEARIVAGFEEKKAA